MAEGYSINPDEEKAVEAEATPQPKKVESQDRFRQFIGDLFKPKDRTEKGEEDEEEESAESTNKRGRFARLWRNLFPSVASKENISTEAKESPRRSIFFEASDIRAQQEISHQETTDSLDDQRPELLPEVAEVITDGPTLKEVDLQYEAPDLDTEKATPNTEVKLPDVIQTTNYNTEPTKTESLDTNPETKVVYGGSNVVERQSLHRIENHERTIEKDTKIIKKELEKKTPEIVIPKPEKVLPEKIDRLVQPAVFMPKVEHLRPPKPAYEKAKSPEKAAPQPDVKVDSEPRFEKPVETLKEADKQRIIEKITHIDKIESEAHKEIAYELSHEHKDLDKQSAAAWTALQASADALSKANAAAIAAAQAAVQDQASVINDVSKTQKHQGTLYKQAAVSGFVTAVIIIAIILILVLVK